MSKSNAMFTVPRTVGSFVRGAGRDMRPSFASSCGLYRRRAAKSGTKEMHAVLYENVVGDKNSVRRGGVAAACAQARDQLRNRPSLC